MLPPMHPYNTFAAADAGARAEALARAVREVARRLDERPRRIAVAPNGTHGVSVRIHAPDGAASIMIRPDQRGLISAVHDDAPASGPWLEFTTAPGLENAIDLYLARQITDENMRMITAERDQADLIRELLMAIAAEPMLRLEPLAQAA